MKRLYTNPQTGQQLVYYDDPRTDPPGWWRNVQIPQRRKHWPWWGWVLIAIAFPVAAIVLLAFAAGLFLKAVVSLANVGNGRTTHHRRCW